MELMIHLIPLSAAKLIGMKRYFTGVPCPSGHISERNVAGASCIACSNERRARVRAADPEKTRREYRESHQRNKAARNEQSRAYRSENPDKVREIHKQSREKRKAQIADYMTTYRLTNRQKIVSNTRSYRERFGQIMNSRTSEWRRSSRDVYLASKAARRAAELRATPAWADMDAIREVYREAARLERESGIPHQVDHFIPLRGKIVCGLHVHYNLRPLPAEENMMKGNWFDPS